jgi:formyl-CoA transferase
MGKPELGPDPRYATYVERARRQQEVHAITEEWTRAHTRQQVVDALVAQDVPVAAILQMGEVINDPYLTQRGALWECDDGIGGKFTLPANTAWFEKPGHTPKIPRLGQHRDDVLQGVLGVQPAEIARLAATGAFGTPAAEALTEEKSQKTVAGVAQD